MNKPIKVSKIVITIDSKNIELTLDQAKELQKILDETFPKKEIQYIPSNPIVIERPYYHRPWHPWWEVTYSSLGGSANESAMYLSCKSTNDTVSGDDTTTPNKPL